MQAFPYENLPTTATIPLQPSIAKVIDRCFLINLDGREDRLREWLDQFGTTALRRRIRRTVIRTCSIAISSDANTSTRANRAIEHLCLAKRD